jgi:hypothetical protein
MSIKYTTQPTASGGPSKSFSVSFLGSKMRFVSIMVRNPNFEVLHFMFKIGGAQRVKWTFLDVQKNVQKMGGKLSFVDSGHRPILTNISNFTIFKRNIFG